MEALDFRFADEDDIADIGVLVNGAHGVEIEGEFLFRKNLPRVSAEELSSDFGGMSVKWIVLETPCPEEKMVGAARLHLRRAVKTCYVDIICGEGSSSLDIVGRLLAKIEHIGFSHGLDKVIVGIPQWRTDLEHVLSASGFDEQSGHMWPEEKSHELVKPTMILEYHKVLFTAAPEKPTHSSAYADGSLLSLMETISSEPDSFGEAKPGMHYNEDGVLCLDFDDDGEQEEEEEKEEGADAVQSEPKQPSQESMETLMTTLFTALHKNF